MRLLGPSLTSSATLTLPSLASSSPMPASYTPHSGNLPSKLGTNCHTLETLQRENTDLQTFIADLDTEIQASRVENGKLAKERQILTGKTEHLEAQLEDLEQNIQQSQEHTAAKDAQYSRIVEMSTRLQSQGAAESQARKVEQHEWSTERKCMQSVIDSLEKEVEGLRKAYGSYAKLADQMPLPGDDCPDEIEGSPDSAAESSSRGPVADIETLRRANARMEGALIGVQRDNAQLAVYIEKLGSVQKNNQTHLQRAETATGALNVLDGEGATAKEQGLMAEK